MGQTRDERQLDVPVLNRSHPLCRGLRFMWVANRHDFTHPRNLVNNRRGALNGTDPFTTADLRMHRVGQAVSGKNDDAWMTFPNDTDRLNSLDYITFAALVRPNSSSSSGRKIIEMYNGSTEHWSLGYGGTSQTWRARIRIGSSTISAQSGTTWALDRFHLIAGRYNGASVDLVANGQLTASTAITGQLATGGNNGLGLWNRYDGSDSYFTGQCAAVWIWDRALCNKCLAMLTERPWDMLRIPRRVERKSTTTIYIEGVSETVTLSENLGAVYTAKPSVAETATLSENLSSTYTAKPSVSESVTLSENLSSTYTAISNVNESVTLSENLSSTYEAKPSVNESVTLSENLGVIYQVSIGVNESITLSENISQYLVFPANVNETVTLSEDLSSAYKAIFGINESVTLGEALSAVIENDVDVSESITLSESLLAGIFNIAGVSESVTLSENLSSIYEAIVVPSESVTLSELLGSQYTALSSINESVSLSESLLSEALYDTGISESVTLSENLSSTYKVIAELSESISTYTEGATLTYTASPSLSEFYTWTEGCVAHNWITYVSISEVIVWLESVSIGIEIVPKITELELLTSDMLLIVFNTDVVNNAYLRNVSSYTIITEEAGADNVVVKDVITGNENVTKEIALVFTSPTIGKVYRMRVGEHIRTPAGVEIGVVPSHTYKDFEARMTKMDTVMRKFPRMYAMSPRSILRPFLQSIIRSDERIGGDRNDYLP